jgi:phosphoribosylaminoimidazole-succinocarboxamide synthase
VQEALLISGLNPDQMNNLIELAQLTAMAIYWLFSNRGIALWDGKFEFILENGRVLLADSIGPDELRLLYKRTHLSKEMIRQVYRGSRWEKALKEAQQLAKERCTLEWKEICINELQASPEPFKPDVKTVVNQLYGTLTNHVSGQGLFHGHPVLDDFVASARVARLDELRGG